MTRPTGKRIDRSEWEEQRYVSLLKAIDANRDQLTKGSVIAIDPSSGAGESAPGIAVFHKGKLDHALQISVPTGLKRGINYTPQRLLYIANELRKNYGDHIFDLLIMEGIHYEINAKTDLKSFQQLNQAIGALTVAIQWLRQMVVFPWEWKRDLPAVYEKEDVMDAITIGRVAIRLANSTDRDIYELVSGKEYKSRTGSIDTIDVESVVVNMTRPDVAVETAALPKSVKKKVVYGKYKELYKQKAPSSRGKK